MGNIIRKLPTTQGNFNGFMESFGNMIGSLMRKPTRVDFIFDS